MMTEEQKIRKREYMKAYREKNREIIRMKNRTLKRKIRAEHPELERNVQRKYRATHPLCAVWHSMMQRCGHFKGGSAKDLANYAGRGITVCEEWRHFKPFEDWCLANGWKKGLQLDRIDTNGNYSPENCRFVTLTQNIRNRRTTVLAAGIPLATWFDAYKSKMNELGLTYKQVQDRFSKLGWSLEKSLFTPLKRRSA